MRAMTCGNVLRLYKMAGFAGRTNDIIYCHPETSSSTNSAVVYFGGDVQDFSENMESHRDNKRYVEWNLENTCSKLHSFFPQHHILVVRPSRMEFKMFSCFDNFVPSDNTGAPEHTPNHHALQHLVQLLRSVFTKTESQAVCEKDDSNTCPSLDKLILIGFSKGCVVLNQFLYEFHFLNTLTPEEKEMMAFVKKISDMYWLDGGHAGGKNTWITARSLLETLARLRIALHIHVTPYQVNDDRRPWIRREEKAFGDLLKKLGAPVSRVLHFENQIPSLQTHFQLLTAFAKTSE